METDAPELTPEQNALLDSLDISQWAAALSVPTAIAKSFFQVRQRKALEHYSEERARANTTTSETTTSGPPATSPVAPAESTASTTAVNAIISSDVDAG